MHRGDSHNRCMRLRHILRLITPLAAVATLGCTPSLERQPSVAAIADDPAARRDPPALAPDRALFEPRAVPSFDALTRLSDEQREALDAWFDAPERADVKSHRRIADFLESELADIRFGAGTSSAAETLAQRRGNCLSMALVTRALADHAGVEIDWILTTNNPVYSSDGRVVYNANHVHARLFDPTHRNDPRVVTMRRPQVLVDFFSNRPPVGGRTLSRKEATSLTFQNLGAEAFADGRFDDAFALVERGLENDPKNPALFNLMGLLHERMGDDERAEAFFRYALLTFGERLVVLRNLRGLLVRTGREAEASDVERRILALPDPDPFPVLALGDAALAEDRPYRALEFYEQARQIAPYLAVVYAGIARAQQRLGNRRASRSAWISAAARADMKDERK